MKQSSQLDSLSPAQTCEGMYNGYGLFQEIPLPQSAAEYNELKRILIRDFQIEDTENSWITLSGVISSTPSTKLHRELYEIVHTLRRLEINKVAQDQKLVYLKSLNDKLEAKLQEAIRKELGDESMQQGTPDIQADVQLMQATSESVASEA